MSDRSDNALPARLWALILLMPGSASFLGMLAKDYLAVRWLAPVPGDAVIAWGTMGASIVSILSAMFFLAVQIVIVGRIYRIDIFPITTIWRSPEAGTPLMRSASSVALVAATTGVALALWAESLVFAGGVSKVGFATFLVATAGLAGLIIAPMIMRGERAGTGRKALS